jgi:Sulfotransferase family
MTASAEQARVQRSTSGRIPDFFIVGHAKSGTTALYEMLRRHPQIFLPENKEPQFFARNLHPPSSADGRPVPGQTGRRVETLADYLALYAAAQPGQRVGDASTFYLWSHDAPARIARAQPSARIVAILREPARFIDSLHRQMLKNHTETERDLRSALALEADRRRGERIPPSAFWPAALFYAERVRYVEQLRRYHAVFPREQVLVLIYDDFRADNEATVRRVLRFLDVDDSLPLGAVEANPSVDVRSPRVRAVLRAVHRRENRGGRAVRSVAKTLTTRRLRTRFVYPLRRRLLFRPAEGPDEQLLAELRHRFAPEVEALSAYLERDLVALWGYDRLG